MWRLERNGETVPQSLVFVRNHKVILRVDRWRLDLIHISVGWNDGYHIALNVNQMTYAKESSGILIPSLIPAP